MRSAPRARAGVGTGVDGPLCCAGGVLIAVAAAVTLGLAVTGHGGQAALALAAPLVALLAHLVWVGERVEVTEAAVLRRGRLVQRALPAAEVERIEVLAHDVAGERLAVLGTGLRAVTVDTTRLAADPQLAGELARFADAARRHGATVAPDAADVLGLAA